MEGSLFEQLDAGNPVMGKEMCLDKDVRLRMDTMKDSAGNEWIPLFFTSEEIEKGVTGNILIPALIKDILTMGLNMESVQGVVINPFGKPFAMNKELLKKVLDECAEAERIRDMLQEEEK
ncbi:MAG: SseB family protein [Lachnospiraceae bacterium]|nr:SseB family protein [Lachnospiraceae bacterium]